jgi:hypothetical protein
VTVLATLVVAVLLHARPGLASFALPSPVSYLEPQKSLSAPVRQASPSQLEGAIAHGRGLQDGWAIDDSCGVMFTPEVARVIANSGAAWARINFRLGASQTWTETLTCDGISALDLYDTVVDTAQAEGLQVLGLLSNESWPGSHAEWQANSAE